MITALLANASTEMPNTIIAVGAAGLLSWMAWMAKQLNSTASANRTTTTLLERLESKHDALEAKVDTHIAAGRERYVGQLEQKIAEMKERP